MTRLTLLALAVYRRWLTRYTPKCPQSPSCGAYAVYAVHRYGGRDGLVMALAYNALCGSE